MAGGRNSAVDAVPDNLLGFRIEMNFGAARNSLKRLIPIYRVCQNIPGVRSELRMSFQKMGDGWPAVVNCAKENYLTVRWGRNLFLRKDSRLWVAGGKGAAGIRRILGSAADGAISAFFQPPKSREEDQTRKAAAVSRL